MPDTPRQSKESSLVELCQKWLDIKDESLADEIDEQLGGITSIALFNLNKRLNPPLPTRQTAVGPQLDRKQRQGKKQIKIPLPTTPSKRKKVAKAKKEKEERQQCTRT